MPVIILILVGLIASTASKQGGELYFFDPGLAEYLVSFIFLGGIIAAVTGLFNKL